MDTILKRDHPSKDCSISEFDLNWPSCFIEDFKKNFPIGFHVKDMSSDGSHFCWQLGVTGYNSERGPTKDHSIKVLSQLPELAK